ncbi:hypothetical protein [Paraburkholderia sp. MM6662-R1]|uniref:hypothetical protein n=1 Tax=Paraburkholderia sp. MM6662-R1 TaxID=2991066 RepID=UPI003D25902C
MDKSTPACKKREVLIGSFEGYNGHVRGLVARQVLGAHDAKVPRRRSIHQPLEMLSHACVRHAYRDGSRHIAAKTRTLAHGRLYASEV